jgi:hypothetical protein
VNQRLSELAKNGMEVLKAKVYDIPDETLISRMVEVFVSIYVHVLFLFMFAVGPFCLELSCHTSRALSSRFK